MLYDNWEGIRKKKRFEYMLFLRNFFAHENNTLFYFKIFIRFKAFSTLKTLHQTSLKVDQIFTFS
jgi:hypothetical protein